MGKKLWKEVDWVLSVTWVLQGGPGGGLLPEAIRKYDVSRSTQIVLALVWWSPVILVTLVQALPSPAAQPSQWWPSVALICRAAAFFHNDSAEEPNRDMPGTDRISGKEMGITININNHNKLENRKEKWGRRSKTSAAMATWRFVPCVCVCTPGPLVLFFWSYLSCSVSGLCTIRHDWLSKPPELQANSHQRGGGWGGGWETRKHRNYNGMQDKERYLWEESRRIKYIKMFCVFV